MLALAPREACQLRLLSTVPQHDVVLEGIHAALWLGSLWFVAPLLTKGDSGANRLRDALILGVAVAFGLGFAGLLWPVAAWLVVTLLLIARLVWRGEPEPPQPKRPFEQRAGIALPILVAAAAAWPALVRPLLQGDSLGYHLPNAASWVQAHSLWTTTTNYWFYPGGSELFAAGLLAAAGPLAVGFAGLGALLLLGLRLYEWGVELGARHWVAGAISAFVLSSFTFAEQAGSLENDVWLAAFFLETLWLMRANVAGAFTRAAAITSLIKPDGWLYAGLALVFASPPWRIVLLALAPLALWAVRDAILWQQAIVSPAGAYYVNWFGTTILANGWQGLTTLWSALLGDGIATAALFAAGLCSIAFARDVRQRIAAAVSLAIFLLHPFGFVNPQPQLATGSSLRYAAPLLALGGLFLSELGRRIPIPTGIAALAIATFGVSHLLGVFSSDATTHGTPFIVLGLAFVLLLPWDRIRSWALPAAGCALTAYAVVLAGSHPLDYYENWLGGGPGRSTFFRWLAATRPPAIVGYGLRIGSISAVSPTTRAIDAAAIDPCREAHNLGALLVVAGDVLVTAGTGYVPRRTFAEGCGPIVFDDGTTIVVNPRR